MSDYELEGAELDVQKRFVRVCDKRDNGFVEFEFAIGEPEIFIEMILSEEAFQEFCEANQVIMLSNEDSDGSPQSDWDWRLADATHFD